MQCEYDGCIAEAIYSIQWGGSWWSSVACEQHTQSVVLERPSSTYTVSVLTD